MTEQAEQDRAASQAQQAKELVDLVSRTFARKLPLFVLVHYEHEADKLNFIAQVQKLAEQQQFATRTYDPHNNPSHSTGKLYALLEQDVKKQVLSLVSALPRTSQTNQPDNDFLTYINLHRDRIANSQLHFVLFLRMSEVATFVHAAPDLWDFRHQTFYLERQSQASHKLLWQNLDGVKSQLKLTAQDKRQIDQHMAKTQGLIANTKDDFDKAQLYLGLTDWLIKHNAPTMAVEPAMEGITLCDGKVTAVLGQLEHTLAQAIRLMCYFADAISHFNNSLAIFAELKDDYWQGVNLNHLSEIHNAQGNYELALEKLERALLLQQRIANIGEKGSILTNIGVSYYHLKDYDRAQGFLDDALEFSESIGDKVTMAVVLSNLSSISQQKSDNVQGLEYLHRALAISVDIGNVESEAIILNNIGEIHVRKEDFEQAEAYLQQALQSSNQIGYLEGESHVCWNMATIYEQKGEYDQAIRYLERVLNIDTQIGSPNTTQTEQYLAKLRMLNQ